MYYYPRNIFFFLVIFAWYTSSVNAQETVNSQVINTDSASNSNGIPPLSMFLDSAMINSPLLKASDKQISQILEQIKKEKKSWADYILIEANTKYGLYDQLTLTDLNTGSTNNVGIRSNKEQFNYFLGLSLRLPISQVTNKKNDLKILSESLEEKRFQKEDVKNQIKQLIIDQYYNLLYLNKSLKINQDMLQATSINLQKSERDLKSGIISIEEYNSVVIQNGKAEDVFYKTQTEYSAQYNKLLIICGISLIDIK